MAAFQKNAKALNKLTGNAILKPKTFTSQFRAKASSSFQLTKYNQIRLHNTNTPKLSILKPLTPEDSQKVLISQRLLRPVAPHLAIYKWQITSVLSVLERITGAILAGSFYLFGFTYAVSTFIGWDLSSASIAAAFGTWPVAAKVATKFAVAFPFTLHAFNSLRFLVWDTAKRNFFTKGAVIRTGWAAVAAATLCAGWLAFL